MHQALLDFHRITSWPTFHAECQRAFGFPEFYGKNMNAWIDCLTYMTDGGDGMSRFVLKRNDVLTIRVLHAKDLSHEQCEILEALKDSIAFVNRRYVATGDIERLRLEEVTTDGIS